MAATTVALIVACVSAVVWLVRLEGRINGHDTLFSERKERSDDGLEAIMDRLKRIENKLDSLDYDSHHNTQHRSAVFGSGTGPMK